MSRLSKQQIWGAPAAVGLLSALGLAAALVADGMGDAISWAALAVPIVVCLRPRRPKRNTRAAPTPRATRPAEL